MTSFPGDQDVVIGYNSSHIELKWNVDLQGIPFDKTRILRYPDRDFSSVTLLYHTNRDPQLLAELQNRMKVTNVVDSGAVTVTLVMRNVTLSDEGYYTMIVEVANRSQALNMLFLTVYGKKKKLSVFVKLKLMGKAYSYMLITFRRRS